MKKVTDKELETLQTLVNTINEGQAAIGGMEVQKQALIKEVEKLIEQLKETQAALEEEYGNVTVNLTTGEITEAEDADNPQD
jgi:vacuolar-type H+-ATPase subunit D/Vma8